MNSYWLFGATLSRIPPCSLEEQELNPRTKDVIYSSIWNISALSNRLPSTATFPSLNPCIHLGYNYGTTFWIKMTGVEIKVMWIPEPVGVNGCELAGARKGDISSLRTWNIASWGQSKNQMKLDRNGRNNEPHIYIGMRTLYIIH